MVNYPDGFPLREVGAQYTPCSWTLVPDNPEVLVVPDTLQDARCDQPQLGSPFLALGSGACCPRACQVAVMH